MEGRLRRGQKQPANAGAGRGMAGKAKREAAERATWGEELAGIVPAVRAGGGDGSMR
jgi:hypothetical protein